MISKKTYHVLVALLLGLAALGRAPAWHHVGCCGSHGSVDRSGEQNENSTQNENSSCCCGHHSHSEEQPAEVPTEPCEDPESCLLCQSLSAPSGVNSQAATAPIFLYSADWVHIRYLGFIASSLRYNRLPRGPPALIS